jgi:hypothetical protein
MQGHSIFNGMNKSLALVIAIIAALALGVWFFTSAPALPTLTDTATTTATATPQSTQATPSAKKPTQGVPNSQNTYKSLLTQSGSYQCDYDQVLASGKGHNVIYLYGGKMRGEFRTDNNGITTANLFIYDGRYLYQWKEGASVGTRTALTSLSQLPLAIPKDLTSGGIVGNSYESVGWFCHTWLTNKSLLTPPSYVTFN